MLPDKPDKGQSSLTSLAPKAGTHAWEVFPVCPDMLPSAVTAEEGIAGSAAAATPLQNQCRTPEAGRAALRPPWHRENNAGQGEWTYSFQGAPCKRYGMHYHQPMPLILRYAHVRTAGGADLL